MPGLSVVRAADKILCDPEPIVIAWIEGEGHAPSHLVAMLQRYRDITIYREEADDPTELDRTADAIFDKLILAAQEQITESTRIAAQLRRIQRKNEARMTYQQKCDHAIAQWRAGKRFGATD